MSFNKLHATLFLISVFCLFSYGLAHTYYNSKKEYNSQYNFIISKTNITPTKSLELYDGTKKIILWNFNVNYTFDIKVGDLLYKPVHSEFVYIYRKNELGENKNLVMKLKFSGIFPSKWF